MTTGEDLTIGEKIKKYRLEKGWTQEKLAKEAEISTISIQQYEGNRRNAKFETIIKIAEALEVPPVELMCEWPEFQNIVLRIAGAELDKKRPEIKEAISKQKMNLERFGSSLNDEDILYRNEIMDYYNELNMTGRKKAAEQIKLLTKIPEYQADK